MWNVNNQAYDGLDQGQKLGVNEKVMSSNGRVFLIMQDDGNLVLYRSVDHQLLWESGTRGATFVTLQENGNLVLYDNSGEAHWESLTRGYYPRSRCILQDDGNFVTYSPGWGAVWHTETVQDWDFLDEARELIRGGEDLLKQKVRRLFEQSRNHRAELRYRVYGPAEKVDLIAIDTSSGVQTKIRTTIEDTLDSLFEIPVPGYFTTEPNPDKSSYKLAVSPMGFSRMETDSFREGHTVHGEKVRAVTYTQLRREM